MQELVVQFTEELLNFMSAFFKYESCVSKAVLEKFPKSVVLFTCDYATQVATERRAKPIDYQFYCHLNLQ